MWTAEIGTCAIRDLVGREQAVRLDDGALAVDPLRLDRVEPGMFDRQGPGQDAHALTLLLDPPVVGADPRPHRLADMPGGVVPDQGPRAHAQRLQLETTPGHERRRHGADGTPVDKAQPD